MRSLHGRRNCTAAAADMVPRTLSLVASWLGFPTDFNNRCLWLFTRAVQTWCYVWNIESNCLGTDRESRCLHNPDWLASQALQPSLSLRTCSTHHCLHRSQQNSLPLLTLSDDVRKTKNDVSYRNKFQAVKLHTWTVSGMKCGKPGKMILTRSRVA